MNETLDDKTLAVKLAGKFIVLDGPDGCGKSTQVKKLAQRLEQGGGDSLTVRDPGQTAIGEAIREILLGPKHAQRDMRCELMLFMASRAQLVAEKIKPALAAGRTVLSDRYVSSSCAYQGAGGLDPREILGVAEFATDHTWPDLTIVLDIPAERGFERIEAHRSHIALDAMEQRSLDFHRKVREIFLQLPSFYPRPVIVVSAEGTVDEVHTRILETLSVVDF
jgi:dTMP kinase